MGSLKERAVRHTGKGVETEDREERRKLEKGKEVKNRSWRKNRLRGKATFCSCTRDIINLGGRKAGKQKTSAAVDQGRPEIREEKTRGGNGIA